MRAHVIFWILMLAVGLSTGTNDGGSVHTAVYVPPPSRAQLPPSPTPDRVVMHLADAWGTGELQTADSCGAVAAEWLSADEADRLLDSLPPLSGVAPKAAFALPDRTLPPPRTGRTLNAPFPLVPDASDPPLVESGPLEVTRHAPEGELPLASHLTVTFNQPMIALGGNARPVILDPQPEGVWRWIGTQTLLFEPKPRFPMATQYEVSIPAGTRSAIGGWLGAAQTWSFGTPPPKVVKFRPGSAPQGLEPNLAVAFDQAIDPEAVLATVHLHSEGKTYPLRLVTIDEIEPDQTLQAFLAQVPPERRLLMRSVGTLPAATDFEISLGPGLPSAEGPRCTDQAEVRRFHTYYPLAVVDHGCGNDDCPPLRPLPIEFNNPLDEQAFDSAEQVTVIPPIPGLRCKVRERFLTLQGRTQALTEYRVILDAGIQDVFGQTLGAPVTLTFPIGEPAPCLHWDLHRFAMLDPTGPPMVPVYAIGIPALDVSIHRMEPTDWEAYRHLGLRDSITLGRKVWEETIDLGDRYLELSEVLIDLSGALRGSPAHLVLEVSRAGIPDDHPRRKKRGWIQCGSIGLSAHCDDEQLLVWATDLASGRPMNDVRVHLEGSDEEARTDSNGLATLHPVSSRRTLLVAEKGSDSAILPERRLRTRPRDEDFVWFVVDDRKLYQPGETVHVKGWVRWRTPGPTGDILPLEGRERAPAPLHHPDLPAS